MLSPARCQDCVVHVQSALSVSERRACRVIGQHRSTQRYQKRGRDDDADLTEAVVALARMYGRYGYRRIWGLFYLQGWQVSLGRVERIWRREGLKVPSRQPKRAHLWLNDGSCIRLRPSWKNHVWSYDFIQDRTDDGKPFRMLAVIDEYSRECLAIVVARRLRSDDVMVCLADLFVQHGVPDHIRSDNGPEFVAKAVRGWLDRLDVKPLYIEPGSSWENGYCESFNGKLRDEFLAREIFSTLKEAQILIERWRRHDNTVRPPISDWLSTAGARDYLAQP